MARRRQTSAPMSLFSFQDIITATTGILILLALVLALSLITQGAESAVEVEFADADRLAYRQSLIAEIESLRKRSTEIAEQSASLMATSPSEIRRQSSQAADTITKLRLSIANAKTKLQEQQTQLKDMEQEATSAALKSQLENLNEEIEQTNLRLDRVTRNNRVVYNIGNTDRTPWLVEVRGDSILAAKAGVKAKPESFNAPAQFNRFAVGLPNSEQYFVILIAPSGIQNAEAIRLFLSEKSVDTGLVLIGEDQVVVDREDGAGY